MHCLVIHGINPPWARIWLKLEMKFQPQLLLFFLLLLQLDLRPHGNDRKSERKSTLMLMMISAMMNFPGISVERKGNSVPEKSKCGEFEGVEIGGGRRRRGEGGDSSGWPAALQHSPKQLIHFMYRDQKEE